MSGEQVRSYCLDQRSDELAEEGDRLQQRHQQLLEERRQVLDNFGQDPATVKIREAYFKNQADFDRQVKDQQRRQLRFLALVRDLRTLKSVQCGAGSLDWTD